MQAVREGGGAENWIWKESKKVLDKYDSMWYYIKVAYGGMKIEKHGSKSLEKNEKSSWQTVLSVLKLKSCQTSGGHKESRKSKNFEKVLDKWLKMW